MCLRLPVEDRAFTNIEFENPRPWRISCRMRPRWLAMFSARRDGSSPVIEPCHANVSHSGRPAEAEGVEVRTEGRVVAVEVAVQE